MREISKSGGVRDSSAPKNGTDFLISRKLWGIFFFAVLRNKILDGNPGNEEDLRY